MSKLNLVDKAIGIFSPKKLAERAHYRRVSDMYAGGFDGANDTRHRKGFWYRGARPVDEDNQIGPGDRSNLRQQCHDLRRNNPIVAGIIERLKDNVVGSGITPQAKSGDPNWDREAEDYWREYSKILDVRGRLNMRGIQRMIVGSRPTDGEVGFILLRNGQIQPIEADRLLTPSSKAQEKNIVEGVKLNQVGRPTAYNIASRNDYGRADPEQTTEIQAQDFIHCPRIYRFDQVRGIPDFCSIINPIRDIGELSEATINKAKMDASRAFAVLSEEGSGKIDQLRPRDVSPQNQDQQMRVESFEFGMGYYMKPGEDVKSLASNTPNPQYMAYLKQVLQIIGSSLGIPYQFLLLDFSEGSFSSSRAALMQTYKTFESWQTWLTDCFLTRLWNWRIAKAIKAGDLPPAPTVNGVSQWWRVVWSFPEYGWIDPKNEAISNKMDWDLGVSSITEISAKKGRDGEEQLRRKAMDIGIAQKLADEMNANYGTSITWRDIISTPIIEQAKEQDPKE